MALAAAVPVGSSKAELTDNRVIHTVAPVVTPLALAVFPVRAPAPGARTLRRQAARRGRPQARRCGGERSAAFSRFAPGSWAPHMDHRLSEAPPRLWPAARGVWRRAAGPRPRRACSRAALAPQRRRAGGVARAALAAPRLWRPGGRRPLLGVALRVWMHDLPGGTPPWLCRRACGSAHTRSRCSARSRWRRDSTRVTAFEGEGVGIVINSRAPKPSPAPRALARADPCGRGEAAATGSSGGEAADYITQMATILFGMLALNGLWRGVTKAEAIRYYAERMADYAPECRRKRARRASRPLGQCSVPASDQLGAAWRRRAACPRWYRLARSMPAPVRRGPFVRRRRATGRRP